MRIGLRLTQENLHQNDLEMPRRRPAGFKRRVLAVFVSCFVAASIVGATLLGLAATGHLPLSGIEDRVAAAVKERVGTDWTVTVDKAALTRIDGHSALTAQDIILRHKSGFAVRAPSGVFSYDVMKLFRGVISLRSVELKGLKISLIVDADGALQVAAGERTVVVAKKQVPGVPSERPPLAALMDVAQALVSPDGQLAGLDAGAITDAHIALVGPDGTERVGFDSVELRFSAVEDGKRRISYQSSSPSGPKRIVMDITSAGDTGGRLAVSFENIHPADLTPLAVGHDPLAIKGLVTKGTLLIEPSTGADKKLSAVLSLASGPGTIGAPGAGIAPLAIDRLGLQARINAGLDAFQVEKLNIASGATDFNVTGEGRAVSAQLWKVMLNGAGVMRGEGSDPSIQIDQVRAELEVEPGQAIRVIAASVKGPKADLSATASVLRAGGDVSLKLGLVTRGPSDARALIGLWPPFASPQIRNLVAERIDAGVIEDLNLQIDFDPAAFKAVMSDQAAPDSSVRCLARGSGLRFRIGPGLPILVDVQAEAIATGRTFNLAAPRARADITRGKSLALSEGTLSIADTFVPRSMARILFRANGGIEALNALLALPALKDYAPGQIEADDVKGDLDLRVGMTLPLADDIKGSEVLVTATGPLTQVSSDKLISGEKIENGTFAINYDKGSLNLKGDAKVGGLPGQIEVRQNARGQGEAVLTSILDQAARQKRGLGFDGKVTGPIPVKFIKTLQKGNDVPPRVEMDLTRVAIDGLLPNWTKPAGRPGRLSFRVETDKDGPDLEDVVLDAAPVSIRGKLSLNLKNEIETGSFTQFRLSPGDDVRVEIARDNGVMKVQVRGAVLDMRSFMKPPTAKEGPREADIDLDLSVPILTGHGAEAISNAVLKLSRRGGEVRSMSFDGRMGRAPVTARLIVGQSGDAQVTLKSADGGGLLRFFDYYKRAYGGELNLTVFPGDNKVRGLMLFNDFTVRNEPALRRVLQDTPVNDAGSGQDRPGGASAQVRGNAGEVAFTKLRSEFTRVGQVFAVQNAVLWGPVLGFTFQGSVDYARDRIDLGGTYIPSYAFNNAFSQVPVLGVILGGGRNEGLFAVNFRLNGAASAPSLSINPLTAIAPGILRRFVDPFGGSQQGASGEQPAPLPER
jgi:Protein of unknown function